MQAFNAILRTKLLYGIEPAVLTEAQPKRLDVFQLKGLRKILKMKIILIERANTNAQVIRTANEKAGYVKEEQKIKLFREHYKDARTKRGLRILGRRPSDPVRFTTIRQDRQSTRFHNFPNKRVGGPKQKWPYIVVRDWWENIKDGTAEQTLRGKTMDKKENTENNDRILQHVIAHLPDQGRAERQSRRTPAVAPLRSTRSSRSNRSPLVLNAGYYQLA